ncbi:acyl CoA:acetate/3-ketoacid CoA transferase [Mesorhizobium sp. CGMCC 1.15528]|uniref:Acetate CoA-transferase YdiF n=1 Tax=Mesorhizobium zhangyense TaxID=1776730 RepID=A0A7C9R9J4_9HYPH|nr:CoA-transferase [Mesorhizobium zhangyense]NGN43560.1 acyl CoA:acetate/3-ketoacid CoA transferase [Mesorhizobium zhangyense]
MTRNKFMSAESAVDMIRNGSTVALIGGGGGLMEPTHVFRAISRKFQETGSPRNLNVIHALGIGDKKSEGMNHFAHKGLVKKVVGGHWVWSPRMQELARDNEIEAYVLPSGCVMQLYREIGGKRPGLFTHVGLGTFVDPRHQGGRMNDAAKDEMVELVNIGGQELLWYKSFPVDVTIIRGSFADADGNISLDQEAANIDVYAAALAAHNSGGIVIAQVRTAVDRNTLPARSVRVPGAIVDAVVVDPEQRMSYEIGYDPTISGEYRGPTPTEAVEELGVRAVIARRAHLELTDNAVINFGVGIGEGVAKIIASRGEVDRYYQTIEHGTYGGSLLVGLHFGFARSASAMIDGPSQFDFYSGGGLDVAFLGFGEIDAEGDVNVSKLGGLTVGPGGFMDIAQNARKVVFCGTFDTKGADIAIENGEINVRRPGQVRKLVRKVEQITYSGSQALKLSHEALLVTERAVFRLTDQGLVLTEVAPGIDIRRDILDQMDFAPLIPSTPVSMDPALFVQ